MASSRRWGKHKIAPLEERMRSWTAGHPRQRTHFTVDRVREVFAERLQSGDGEVTASRIAWETAHDECRIWGETEGILVDDDARFEGCRFEDIQDFDLERDLKWACEMLGRKSVRKRHAPSGHAWHLYSNALEGDEGKKMLCQWAQKVIRPKEAPPAEEPEEEDVDAGELGFLQKGE